MADLEAALPNDVRVSRIAVRSVTIEGDQTIADLELVVFSKVHTTVLGMITDMQRQGVFHATLRAQNLQKGRGEIGTEYELDVMYRPRVGYASESVAKVNDDTSATGEAK